MLADITFYLLIQCTCHSNEVKYRTSQLSVHVIAMKLNIALLN